MVWIAFFFILKNNIILISIEFMSMAGGHPSMNQVIKALSTNDVMEHLRALMEVASHHHNSRSIRNGYNASAEYIIHQLENSGAYDLTTQPFSVSIWEKIQETEFIVLTASGDVVVFKDQQDFISMAKSSFPILTLYVSTNSRHAFLHNLLEQC